MAGKARPRLVLRDPIGDAHRLPLNVVECNPQGPPPGSEERRATDFLRRITCSTILLGLLVARQRYRYLAPSPPGARTPGCPLRIPRVTQLVITGRSQTVKA